MRGEPQVSRQDQEEIQASELDVVIDREGEVPIGVQLAWALRVRIGERRFQPGQRLPGLRELAVQAGVNVNTARAVYQRLEQEGLIETQQGSGTFVAASPREGSQAGAIAAGAARRARQAGVDPREVAAALYMSAQLPSETEHTAAARRAMLRTQIAALETTLGELEGAYPGVAPPPAAAGSADAPRMLDTVELEHVRAELVRRLSIVQAAVDALTDEEPPAQEERPAPRKSTARKRVRKPSAAPTPAGA
jgi:DNA-binding transcriptional regulator YhcF (GntR family)